MKPKFTDNEEKMIAYILKSDSPVSALSFYIPWLLISGVSFGYGACKANVALMVVGFSLSFLLCLWFVYYQIKPSWNVKSIIEKYEQLLEAACLEDDELA